MPETNLSATIEVANRLSDEVQNTRYGLNWQIDLSLSYGAESATAQDTSLDQLMQRADVLLYEMKSKKNNLSPISPA
jgi:GGDEF domain-containing protein